MLRLVACTCSASLLAGVALQLGVHASIHGNQYTLITAAFAALVVVSATLSAAVYKAMQS